MERKRNGIEISKFSRKLKGGISTMIAIKKHKPSSPLHYFGGKGWLSRKIHRYMPPHKAYVELFAGSAKILFTKPPSPVEVINDLDSGLVNFFRVLRHPIKYLELQKLAALTPYSREEFTYCKKHWEEHTDDVLRAWAWYVAARQARCGLFGSSWSCETKPAGGRIAKNVGGWLSSIEHLPEFHQRLSRVQVENQDFRNIIPKFDSPDTWFYADPPYVQGTRSSGEYTHEMTDNDHVDLVNLLLNLKGTCLLSGYPHPIYEPLEMMGWRREEFKVFCYAAKVIKSAGEGVKGTRPTRTECLWLNPNLQKVLEEEWSELPKAA
jgi:DNA adenine methylase